MINFVWLLLLVGITAQDHGNAPASPLGENTIGSMKQYQNLRDNFYFDVSEDAGSYSFDIDYPPLFLDLARQDVGNAWHEFVSSEYRSQCLYGNGILDNGQPTGEMLLSWAGQCKGTMSKLRDALNKFSAIYPSAGDRYKEDPWDILQEDVAHQGYSRSGNLVDRVTRSEEDGIAYWHQYVAPWIQNALYVVGEYGDKHIFGDPNLPIWSDYANLKGNIANDGGGISSTSPFETRFGTEAIQNKQFWGTNTEMGAKTGFDGYENLALLFRVQLLNAFGKDDKDWYEVMGYRDLTVKNYGSYTCELRFHDLRKIIRMMWRTASDNPQILPLSFFPASIDCPSNAVGCVGGKFLYLSADAQDLFDLKVGGVSLLKQIFTNSAESKQWLRGLGWNDATIQVATSMALGGYYHLDYYTLEPGVTEAMADANMDTNAYTWDFIQRMGYIHDLLLDYTLQAGRGVSDTILNPIKDRINSLWLKFVNWCDKNQMLDLLKYKLDPYFPLGNESASRELAPTLPISNIPFLLINTHGKTIPCLTLEEAEACAAYTGDEDSINATLSIWENSTRDEPVNRSISIKAHGESSRAWPKKTFGIKFYNKAGDDWADYSFLGLTSNDEFVLKGFYIDMTMNRDAFAYNLSRSMDQWAPRTRQAEMYLITDEQEISFALHYQGVYTVCETISRGSHRVPINKNKPDVPLGEGGYIFTVDKFDARYETFHTVPVSGNNVQIKYPGRSSVSEASQKWGFDRLDAFELAMFGEHWLETGHPESWSSYVDLESWAKYFIIAEVMKSVDAYRFSTYFWWDGNPNSTFKFGPSWDYDLSSGNTGWVVDLTGQVKQTHSWQYMWARTIATDIYTGEPQSIPQVQHTPCAADWFYRMLDVPEFKNKVSEVWWDYRHTALSDEQILNTINAQKDELKKGSNRNFAKWPTLDRVDIWPHFPPPIETSLEGKWDQLRDYLLGRVAWLDANIYGYLPHGELGENTTCDPGAPIPDCLNGFNTFPPPYSTCNGNPWEGFWWVRSNWQSNFKFFMNHSHGYNDGSDCGVLEYLHWEATEAGGPMDCPVPGGPDNFIPKHYDPSTPMDCTGTCGTRDTPGMSDPCWGTITWLETNWKTSAKYYENGVDAEHCDPAQGGSQLKCRCACQKFLEWENPSVHCPKVRGSDTPLFCVQNKCQKTQDTWSPTATWTPPAPTQEPTKQPTKYPTNKVTGSPSRAAGPKTCANVLSDANCSAALPGMVAVKPETLCTTCGADQCCRSMTCADLDWCDLADSGVTGDACSEDACKKFGPTFMPAGGEVGCDKCDLTECCTEKTCETATVKCPAGERKMDPAKDDSIGCNKCDIEECCVVDEDAPRVPTPRPPGAPTTNSAAGGGGGGSGAGDTPSAAGPVIGVLIGLAALGGGGFLFIRQRNAKRQGFVHLNDDNGEYAPPATSQGIN